MKRARSTSVTKGGALKSDQKTKSAHLITPKARKKEATGKRIAPVKVNNLKKQKSIEDDTEDIITAGESSIPWMRREKSISLQGKFNDIDSLPSIVKAALQGVSPDVFYEFAKLIDMPDRYLAALINTSPRTISNYKEQKKSLDPVKGEHLLRFISLCKKGEQIFANFFEFHGWLFKPQPYAIAMPAKLLVTPGGVELVSQELDRVAYGYAL
ncbi:MAG TPA: antitoxin Xre-like helix-turn-helix domain-containing protein [Chitinophaga sp.]